MNYYEIRSQIESLPKNPSSLQKLQVFAEYSDAEVRVDAIEALSEYGNDKDIAKLLISHLKKDEDELVRTSCAEILGSYPDKEVSGYLVEALDDESDLVIAAAALSLAEISDVNVIPDVNVIGKLESKLEKASPWLSVSLHIGLYFLGEKNSLELLLKFLNNDDYRVRCATANLLKYYSKPEDVTKIINILKSRLQIEQTRAVLSSIKSAIEDLSEIKK